ncbi:aspartate aminotransferase family protein [Conexibacter arvalis]|uniref:Adenosylmethionine-8-amino-7-oxononanoate aminotransferase n=1 Tax=Conexibacter arvalis TaxID=912552 RepID=A0A840IBF5_9ACTN|nr:aspartate aminotransferase family protein [Conexibacter arvalis]MBB4661581.1 adenosylmethionine-8-amino-7-oxononanoate aminotransferase [Conexibacter arvalis]
MTTDRSDAAVADTRLWHPFSDMAAVRRSEFLLTRGEGVWVFDDEGRRYLDGTASLWYANVGHGRREIADAVMEQFGKLEAYSAFGDFTTPPAQELAARIADLSPLEDARVFFTTGGGEALDSAAKIARRYWNAKGKPERVHIIGRTGGYHGTNGYGTSIGGIEANRSGFGPLMPQTSQVQWDSLTALEEEILRVGADRVAAVFAEPVIGAGGVLPPPEGYLQGVQAICEEHGILFVADEVICGFGRLGHWFGSERFGLTPDMLTFAKGVTSGYLPLGGVVASARVAEPFWDEPGNMLRHGATYSAHAACCVAGLANIDLLEREGMLAGALELESVLLDGLKPFAANPLVREVRGGVGLLAAVEFTAEALANGAPAAAFAAARERGVLVRALGQGIAVSPPLNITREELGVLADGIGGALDAVAAASVA